MKIINPNVVSQQYRKYSCTVYSIRTHACLPTTRYPGIMYRQIVSHLNKSNADTMTRETGIRHIYNYFG